VWASGLPRLLVRRPPQLMCSSHGGDPDKQALGKSFVAPSAERECLCVRIRVRVLSIVL
jgi:hypothetical protein